MKRRSPSFKWFIGVVLPSLFLYTLAASDDVEDRIQSLTDFATGLSHQITGDPEKALESWVESVVRDPSPLDLVYQVVEALLRKEDWETTLKVVEKAQEHHVEEPKLWFLESVAQRQLGRLIRSRRALETAIEKDPTFWPSWQQLIVLRLENGELDKVNAILKEAHQVEGVDIGFLLDMTQIYFDPRVREYIGEKLVGSRVTQLMDRADGTDQGQDPPVLQRLADYALALERYERAETYLLKLVERFPDALGPRQKLAEAYIRTERHSEAAEQIKILTRLQPTNAQFHYLMGSLELEMGRVQEALEYFITSNQLAPAFLPVYYELLSLYVSMGDAERALATWNDLMEKSPPQFATHYYRGIIASMQKDFEQATSSFKLAEEVAKEKEPDKLSAAFYFQFGAYLERAGKFEESAVQFRKCIELQSDHAEALNYLGYMWADLGFHLKEALDLIEKAIELEPANPAYLDSLAWVHFKLGNMDKALPPMQKAMELIEEPDPVLFDHLGDIYKALGDLEKAKEAWQKSFELEKSPEVQKKIESVSP